MELETPPPFMENSIPNFHFVFRNTSLIFSYLGDIFCSVIVEAFVATFFYQLFGAIFAFLKSANWLEHELSMFAICGLFFRHHLRTVHCFVPFQW